MTTATADPLVNLGEALVRATIGRCIEAGPLPSGCGWPDVLNVALVFGRLDGTPAVDALADCATLDN